MVQIPIHILWTVLVILILFSVFFSASETGMMSLNRYRLRHMARKGIASAKLTAQLLKRPDRLLGVVLIGNTFANILASAITTILAGHYFGDIGILFSTIGLALVILIFAETAPKTLAALHPEGVAFLVAWPLKYLLKILYPLVWLVNGIANSVLTLFRVQVGNHRTDALSIDELRTIVYEGSSKISNNYKKMLLRILDLERVTVEDIMVPRSEIYGINLEEEWPFILNQLLNCPYAEVPLYRTSIDQVAGMLNLRKILILLQKHTINKDNLLTVAQKVYFVPKGAILNRQLLNFQHEEQAAGLVVDEYGDIQGLITLQDVVQEVVGEFTQDVSVFDGMIKPQADGSYIVDARINMRDLTRSLHWNLPLDGPKTLSGLIVEYLEMIPSAGIGVRIAGYPMEVLKMRGNAVRWVKILPDLKTSS